MDRAGGRKDARSRRERRKETAEDFTPLPLVNEMLDHLPAEVWTNPDQTFLDPSCGDGNFLVEVKKRLLAAGHSEGNALSRIFGIDIMHDNVVESCKRLGVEYNPEADFAVSANIVCANTLEHEGKIPELFEKAAREFFCAGFDSVLLELKPLLEKAPKSPRRDIAVAAWKAGRRLVRALNLTGKSLD